MKEIKKFRLEPLDKNNYEGDFQFCETNSAREIKTFKLEALDKNQYEIDLNRYDVYEMNEDNLYEKKVCYKF